MGIAFNKISFNIGLLAEVKEAKTDDFLRMQAEKIILIADALNTERFAENYPQEELQDCTDLWEDINYVRRNFTDSELWGKVWNDYIVPAGRKLAKFTVEVQNNDDLYDCIHPQERIEWQKLIDVLAGWERTPHMPKVYAELIPAA